jgi:hypothetical protein
VHAVAERLDRECRVLGEAQGGVAIDPPAGILERLRQVPVVERRERADTPLEQAVDESAVERQPLLIRLAGAVGLDAGPGDREPVRLETEGRHQVEVGVEPVIVVVGDIAGVAVDDTARGMAEGVPDRRPAPVLLHGSLDLVRGRSRTDHEAGREDEAAVAVGGGSDGGHPGILPYR